MGSRPKFWDADPANYPFPVTIAVDERYGRFGSQHTAFHRTFFSRRAPGRAVEAIYQDAYGCYQPVTLPHWRDRIAGHLDFYGLGVEATAPAFRLVRIDSNPPDYVDATFEDRYRDTWTARTVFQEDGAAALFVEVLRALPRRPHGPLLRTPAPDPFYVSSLDDLAAAGHDRHRGAFGDRLPSPRPEPDWFDF